MRAFLAGLSRPLQWFFKHMWSFLRNNKKGIVLAAILVFSGYLYN